MIECERILKSFRKKPIVSALALGVSTDYGIDEIQRIIPHRDPLLFLDRIIAIDLESATIAGKRTIRAEDPVFRGHFPDFPVYPAVFQLETVGQLGLCLHYFLNNRTTCIRADFRPVSVRVTRVLGAHFIEPVLPSQELTLYSQRLQADSFLEVYIGQVLCGTKVCSVSIGEICIL